MSNILQPIYDIIDKVKEVVTDLHYEIDAPYCTTIGYYHIDLYTKERNKWVVIQWNLMRPDQFGVSVLSTNIDDEIFTNKPDEMLTDSNELINKLIEYTR